MLFCLDVCADAQREAEQDCGTLGHRACLDSATGVNSCASPGPDGSMVRAMQPNDDPMAPFMCLSCDGQSLPSCPETHPEDDTSDLPPGSCSEKMRRSRARFGLNLTFHRVQGRHGRIATPSE